MANRQVDRNKTLDQQRVIINQIASDVGDIANLTTADKSSVTSAVVELKSTAGKVGNVNDITTTSDLSIPFLADTNPSTTLKYNSNISYQPSTATLKSKNLKSEKLTLPEGTDQTPSLVFTSTGRSDVGIYRKNDSVGVGFTGRPPQIFFNADGTISSAGVQTSNASELALTNNPKCLYVSEQEYYATDSWSNNGLSLNKPFKSITRALLEASRQSYIADISGDKNNDRFEYFTIIVFPGNYEIDNRPGTSLTVQNAIDFFANRNNYGPTGKIGTVVPANLVATTSSSFVYNTSSITLSSATGIAAGLRVAGAGIPDGTFVKSDYVSGTTINLVNSSGTSIQTTSVQNNVTIEFYQSVALRNVANYPPAPATGGVPATGGSGNGVTFDVSFTGTGSDGEIIVKANNLGTGYFTNEILTISSANLGNTGNLNLLVTTLFDDSEVAITNNLYRINPPSGGVIVPRGTSIVGLDLRKTVIRPKYVPDPTIPPSGDQRALDAANLIKVNREYIQSEAFGYLQSKRTAKSITSITNGLSLYASSSTTEPDVFTCTSHGFVENTPIKFLGTTTNTTLNLNQVYYIDYVSANTFRIKAGKTEAPLSNVVSSNQTPSGLTAYSFNIGSQSCKRDIGYFIDALVYDIGHGGNSRTYDNAEYYIDGVATKLIKGQTEIADTLTCLKYATNLAASAVRNHQFTLRATRNATTNLALSTAVYGLTEGMLVSGTGIGPNVSISAIVYNANGSASSVTLSAATTGSGASDYTFDARSTYKYGFVTPYYDSKFDTYPNFDNSYQTTAGTTTKCQSTVASLFTLYTIFNNLITNPTTYFVSGNGNYIQKSYPYGYDRDLETAIFRVTGGCYFWQMTFKDGDQTNRPYYVNAAGSLTQYTTLTNEPSDAQKEAYRILKENRSSIINSTYDTLLAQYPSFIFGAPLGSTTEVINTYKAKCKRDIGYIFDSVATDLFDGGNANTVDSTLLYLNATQTGLSTNGLFGETAQSIFAFDTLKVNMQALVEDIGLDAKITTLIGYLTSSLTSPGSINFSAIRNENNNTGQFPCSHHKLVTFKFASKVELSEYYDKIETIYNANFEPDIPATSTAIVTSITDDTSGDIFTTSLNHGFNENTPVKFRAYNDGNITLNSYKTYYVKYLAKNKFKLKNASSIVPYASNQAADAYNSILSNLSLIANEAYYAQQRVGTFNVLANSTAQDCIDDIMDVLKAIAYNVKYAYNDRTWEAGNIYATGRYVTGNKTETIGALNFARDYAIAAMKDSRIAPERTLSSISRSGTTVTVNTGTIHGYTTGDKVVITVTNSAFNTTDVSPATITVTTTTAFTYTLGTGTIAAGATGTFRKADSVQTFYPDVTRDASSPLNYCASIAGTITTLAAIVTTAITNETMIHALKTSPPITPTEENEEVLSNIVSSTQNNLSIKIFDADAYSQRIEENRIVGDASKATTIDTVSSASPYIFNCSLRSVYGMSGLHANGEDTTGFKSMVLAQYTGISLQRDSRAFTRLKYLNGLFCNKVNSADDRFTKVDSEYIDYWRNYHVKASNNGFLQVVSVFAVGYADHFISDTGSDISITNSNSNFGNIATLSTGYKEKAFAQDTGGQIVGVIPPKGIDYSRTNAVIINEIDYRTITKWAASRTINGGIGENRFGKLYIKSSSVNGLYAQSELPEYTDASGKKWLLIDGINYLLGKGKNLGYKSEAGNYETNSSQNEYIYGSFTKFNGSTDQAEYRSRLRQWNVSNPLDGQLSYFALVNTKTSTYTSGVSTIPISDSTGIVAGLKITSSLAGIPNNTFVGASYISGSLNIPLVNSSGVSVTTTVGNTSATLSFYRGINTADNSIRQFYGWEYAETSNGIDLGSLVLYIDEYVMYDDVFYHKDYRTQVQNRADIAGQSAVFPGSSVVSIGAVDPSGNTVSGIPLDYNDGYSYAFGNILKRILQRYDSDVNYALNTSDSLEYQSGTTIANSYIKRVSDSRLTKDHIWRFIYKIPKELNAKPPERKYVIQLLSNDAPSYYNSFYIYDVETIDEYIADTQDGIYYLTILDANIKNIRYTNNVLQTGYSQNQYFLYPEVNLDNPEWNPKEAISVFDNDVKIRTVVLDNSNLSSDNYERVTSYSITGEITKKFINYITDSNCRLASLSSSSLNSSSSDYSFNDTQQIYTNSLFNVLGVSKDIYSGSILSDRVVKFQRTSTASPNNTELLNVSDIEKLTVGAKLISISPSGGGTIPSGVSITILNIDTELKKVTLSSSISVSNANTTYTYEFDNPIQIKIHRPSNIRASGHTWEYVGYGPGNYSTAFPVFASIVLNRQQVINSQTIERNGGFNGSSGTNSNGDFFIGTQVIDTKGSQSETVNVPKLKTSAQNRLIDPDDLLFITAASSSGTGNLSAFSENLQNTVRTQLSDQSSKTVTYDKVTVANLEVGTNIKISGSIDIKNSNMNAVDSVLLFPKFSADGKKYGFAKRVDTEAVNWSASRLTLPDDGFVTAKDLGDWAYINRVTGSAIAQTWSTSQDGQFLYAKKVEGVTSTYTFEYGSNFTYTPTSAQLDTTNFYLKIGKTATTILTANQGLSGFIYVNVEGIRTAYPVIKGLDPLDVNGGVEWRALKNAWLNPETSENGISGNFVISYYIYNPSLIIYNINTFEV